MNCGVVHHMNRLAASLWLGVFVSVADGAPTCVGFGDTGRPCRVYVQGKWLDVTPGGLLTTETHSAKLTLPEHFYVDEVRYESLGSLAVFVFGITDAEAGSLLVALVDPHAPSIKWSVEIPAFNGSEPLVDGSAVYVAGIGTVAKLSVKDGRILWIHTGLHDRTTQAYNAFVRPRKESGTVVFTESKVGTARYEGIREVRVDDSSGKILSK